MIVNTQQPLVWQFCTPFILYSNLQMPNFPFLHILRDWKFSENCYLSNSAWMEKSLGKLGRLDYWVLGKKINFTRSHITFPPFVVSETIKKCSRMVDLSLLLPLHSNPFRIWPNVHLVFFISFRMHYWQDFVNMRVSHFMYYHVLQKLRSSHFLYFGAKTTNWATMTILGT